MIKYFNIKFNLDNSRDQKAYRFVQQFSENKLSSLAAKNIFYLFSSSNADCPLANLDEYELVIRKRNHQDFEEDRVVTHDPAPAMEENLQSSEKVPPAEKPIKKTVVSTEAAYFLGELSNYVG